jgi:hypothetical protein
MVLLQLTNLRDTDHMFIAADARSLLYFLLGFLRVSCSDCFLLRPKYNN